MCMVLGGLSHIRVNVFEQEQNRMSFPADTEASTNSCFRFLIMGKTGSGKSSLGNTILGSRVFDVGPSFGSVTKRSQSHTASVNSSRIKIIDTPGLFDLTRPLDDAAAIMTQTLEMLYPGPDAVLYVIRIGRFTEEQLYDYKAVLRYFGEDVKKHIIVVFAGFDKLDEESLESELKHTHEDLKTILDDCENRYVTFDNCANNKTFQVEKLFRETQNLMAANGGKHFCVDAVNEADKQAIKDRLAKIFNQLDCYEMLRDQ